MGNKNQSKLNYLLNTQPSGIVFSSAWLAEQGYSHDLQKRYKSSKWFESIGSGALIRHNDQVDYLGAIYALQKQLNLTVHPAAKTALSMMGKAHYLQLAPKSVQLFGGVDDYLPHWFRTRNWGIKVNCRLSSFLPPKLGLVEVEHKGFNVKVSNPARAVMECLLLTDKSQPLFEVYELMEGLNNLRPAGVQNLLEACNSVKVKRLFLYLADKADHEWFNYINFNKINLGSGKRVAANGGVYISKYQITVPKELGAAE